MRQENRKKWSRSSFYLVLRVGRLTPNSTTELYTRLCETLSPSELDDLKERVKELNFLEIPGAPPQDCRDELKVIALWADGRRAKLFRLLKSPLEYRHPIPVRSGKKKVRIKGRTVEVPYDVYKLTNQDYTVVHYKGAFSYHVAEKLKRDLHWTTCTRYLPPFAPFAGKKGTCQLHHAKCREGLSAGPGKVYDFFWNNVILTDEFGEEIADRRAWPQKIGTDGFTGVGIFNIRPKLFSPDTAMMAKVCEKLAGVVNTPCPALNTACFIGYFGTDGRFDPHQDRNEDGQLDPNTRIMVATLCAEGGERDVEFMNAKTDKVPLLRLTPKHGDIVSFDFRTNKNLYHAVRPSKKVNAPTRVACIFRTVTESQVYDLVDDADREIEEQGFNECVDNYEADFVNNTRALLELPPGVEAKPTEAGLLIPNVGGKRWHPIRGPTRDAKRRRYEPRAWVNR